MKTILITFSLASIFSLDSLGCRCDFKSDFKSQADLAEYDFISYVKILSIETAPENRLTRSAHRIGFKIIEHFKGTEAKDMLVYGGNSSLTIPISDCDLGENVNEEWIIFGQIDKATKEMVIEFCSRTSRYRRADGYRYHGYAEDSSKLDKLRAVFQKAVHQNSFNGKHLEYYKKGFPEIEEYYLHKKLEGIRYTWFPNKTLESKQSYKLGLRHGTSEWYSETGQLLRKEKFSQGIQIDTATYWHRVDTSHASVNAYAAIFRIPIDSAKRLHSSIHISNQHIYDLQGNLLYSTEFNRLGIKTSESAYAPEEKKEITRYFHDNGSLRSELYRVNGKSYGTYNEWDEHGDVVKSWRYDEEGKQIKESIKIGKEANR